MLLLTSENHHYRMLPPVLGALGALLRLLRHRTSCPCSTGGPAVRRGGQAGAYPPGTPYLVHHRAVVFDKRFRAASRDTGRARCFSGARRRSQPTEGAGSDVGNRDVPELAARLSAYKMAAPAFLMAGYL